MIGTMTRDYTMDRCLVTGGAGFIGSHLVRELLNRGNDVRVLDNFSTGKEENLRDVAGDIEIIRGDVRDRELLGHVLTGVRYVFHQAALGSVPRSIEDPFETQSSNVDGTLNLLWEARAKKVQRVMIAGSSSVYGDTPGMPRVEELPVAPLSPYALSKLSQEFLGRIFTQIYGLETVTLRYFNIFGPRQDPDSLYAAVIARFIGKVLSDEPLSIYGSGNQSRDFTYVANAVDANMRAMAIQNGIGEAYNVGCGESISILKLVNELQNIFQKQLVLRFLPARQGDPLESRADIQKAEKVLGYRPLVTFEEGLRRTVEWFSAASNHQIGINLNREAVNG